MTLLATLFGTISALLAIAAGYSFGMRRGAVERDHLWRQNLDQMDHIKRAHQELAAQRDEKRSNLLRRDLVKLLELLLQQGNALQRMLRPLYSAIGEADTLRSAVKEALSPLMQKERLGSALSNIDSGADHQNDLTGLLNEIASVGGFRTVVLSDDQGLTLAHNDNPWDLERTIGLSSFLLVLAERVARDGAPAPRSLMVQDEEGGVFLCRAFRVQDSRLLLTAVAAGTELALTSLDPTLPKVNKILSDRM